MRLVVGRRCSNDYLRKLKPDDCSRLTFECHAEKVAMQSKVVGVLH